MGCQNCACHGCREVLIELVSADGFVYPKLLARPINDASEYRTVVSPPINYMALDESPTAPAHTLQQRVYRWNGKTRRDVASMREVRILEEELPRPLPPPIGVSKERVRSLISKLTAEGRRQASQAVSDRMNGNTHLGASQEATASALTNVVLELKALLK